MSPKWLWMEEKTGMISSERLSAVLRHICAGEVGFALRLDMIRERDWKLSSKRKGFRRFRLYKIWPDLTGLR